MVRREKRKMIYDVHDPRFLARLTRDFAIVAFDYKGLTRDRFAGA